MTEQWDVVIVGGGPAGATAGGLLARRGYRVLIIEREKFPRYHIGESLVSGVMPVVHELGFEETRSRFGFVEKYGVTLLWGDGREPTNLFFGEVGPFEHSFQVVRSEFDYLLLQHARRLGATVLEETRVLDIHFDGERCTGVTYGAANRQEDCRVEARVVLDASGQAQILGRQMDLLEWDSELKNIAVWAYFQDGRRLAGKAAGNILIENRPQGWLWTIPLHDGTQSVGWVTPQSNLPDLDGNLGDAILATIADSVETRRLLASARRVSKFHTTRDWSYTCTRIAGPGYLMVGDAAGFVDPLFSTGVFLAMNGASLAAKTVDQMLRQPEREEELGQRYHRAYSAFLDTVFSIVHFFYEASREIEVYWGHAQTLVDPQKQMTSRQDFMYLISGLCGVHTVLDLEPRDALAELERGALAAAPA
jgi:clorobiocin biosynthesis protein Clo-hal